MTKPQKIKYISLPSIGVLLLTFIALYSISGFLLLSDSNTNTNSIDLLEKSPRMVFGSSKFKGKEFTVNLDEIGVALALFPTKNIISKDFSQLQLSLEGLPNNYQVKLVTVAINSQAAVELPLLQTNGKSQSNLLFRDSNWTGEVSQIGLRILPQDELGLSITHPQSIKINSITLNNNNYFQNYFTLFNYWLDYEPWEYLSISHLKSNSLLPLYAQPTIFTFIWIVLYLLIYRIFVSKNLNYTALLVAWLFLDILFLHNMNASNNWVKEMYSSDTKLVPDDDLFKIANRIESQLNNDTDTISQNTKIFILPSDGYRDLRLIYHLLPLNVGFYTTSLKQKEINHGDIILSYSTNGEIITPNNKQLIYKNKTTNIEVITSDSSLIVMRVLK